MTPTKRSYDVVFLGGTVGRNPWRQGAMERLMARGLPRHAVFDPVVKDWNEEAQAREERVKREPTTLLLFYLGDPQDPGVPVSAFSLVEATLAVCNDRERTVLVFDSDGIGEHGAKVLAQTEKLLHDQAPDVPIYHSLDEAEGWIVEHLTARGRPKR